MDGLWIVVGGWPGAAWLIAPIQIGRARLPDRTPTDQLSDASRVETATRSRPLEPTVTMSLDRSAFRKLMDEDAEIREAVLLGVARWLRRLTDQVSDLHFLDLRGRVCTAIVRLARQQGAEPTVPTELPAITQADLAALASGTRQLVSTILGELAAEGLIQYDGKRITVVDVDRLAQTVER